MESISILHGTNLDVLVRPRHIYSIGEAILSYISDTLFETNEYRILF